MTNLDILLSEQYILTAMLQAKVLRTEVEKKNPRSKWVKIIDETRDYLSFSVSTHRELEREWRALKVLNGSLISDCISKDRIIEELRKEKEELIRLI